MKKSEKSILGQRLAALRKRPHLNNGQFFSKMRREQERERKKLGIRFVSEPDGWEVWDDDDEYCGVVFKDGRAWVGILGSSETAPHRTRLEAAKALLGEAR